jgi:hypothetical protein
MAQAMLQQYISYLITVINPQSILFSIHTYIHHRRRRLPYRAISTAVVGATAAARKGKLLWDYK